jgi:hypothetical protein
MPCAWSSSRNSGKDRLERPTAKTSPVHSPDISDRLVSEHAHDVVARPNFPIRFCRKSPAGSLASTGPRLSHLSRFPDMEQPAARENRYQIATRRRMRPTRWWQNDSTACQNEQTGLEARRRVVSLSWRLTHVSTGAGRCCCRRASPDPRFAQLLEKKGAPHDPIAPQAPRWRNASTPGFGAA